MSGTAATSPLPSLADRTSPAAPGRYVLSRFAYVRRDGGALVLESARVGGRIVLSDRRTAALVGALAEPGTVAELEEHLAFIAGPSIEELLPALVVAGFVRHVRAGADATCVDEPAVLRTWSFHDLLFHTRRRRGSQPLRQGEPTAPGSADSGPEPAACGVAMSLPLEEEVGEDGGALPFARVQDARRSLRSYGDTITLGQLSQFLAATARVQRPLLRVPDPLGVYPVVGSCRGLESGLYRYEAAGHGLVQLCGRTPEVERMLGDAMQSAALANPPQILLVLTARQRLGVPYALRLQQVGAFFQRMYLAATMMRLAPCALGCGDSDAFARAAGAGYWEEPSIGEFLLGSKA